MTFTQFLERMDRQIWFRAIVCLLPGVVLTKAASQFDLAMGIRMAFTLVLGGGAFLFLYWRRVISAALGDGDADAANDDDTAEASGPRGYSTMEDLVALCGNERDAHAAMLEELEMDPELGPARAVDLAVRRRLAKMRVAARDPDATHS